MDTIKQDYFLIYESKSNKDLIKVTEQIQYREKFVEGFLAYFKEKYEIKNDLTYLGFFRHNTNIHFPSKKEKILKKNNINYAILQNDISEFGEKILFEKEEITSINEVKIQIKNINENTEAMKKEIEGCKNEIKNTNNKIENVKEEQKNKIENVKEVLENIKMNYMK